MVSNASPTALEEPASAIDQIINLTNRFLTSWLGQFTGSVAAVTALLIAYQKLNETLIGLLPAQLPKWALPSGVLALIFFVACIQAIPAAYALRRKRRREAILTQGLKVGYFQLGPRKEGEVFKRGDNKHKEVLDWVRNSQEQILYLTGKSGCGKTSLLDAFVVPQLMLSTSGFMVIKVRGYQHPVNALQEELRRPGVIWQETESRKSVPISTLLKLASRQVHPQ
jgi:chromosomal replication initiation ATPase DnaA